MQQRFTDQKKTLRDFYREVWVVCPSCSGKAFARHLDNSGKVQLSCASCAYAKAYDIKQPSGHRVYMAAHHYFDARLWLQAPFRQHMIFAYNLEHLNYLEAYIQAGLREKKDRTHFTLLEKLPRFYHQQKNREDLLKVIRKLKHRS